MTSRGEIVGRTPETPGHTHGRVETAMLAHADFRSDEWQQYQIGGQREVLWEATTLYGRVDIVTRGCIFATLPEDISIVPPRPRNFYLNTGGRPLVQGGRTFWQWHIEMTPDEKEEVAPLSVAEMDILLILLRIGRYHGGDVSELYDGGRQDAPHLRVVSGTEPRFGETEPEKTDEASRLASLLGRLSRGRKKPGK